MKEPIADRLRRCGDELLKDEPHTFWQGVIGWSHSVIKLGSKSYPVTPYIEIRQGHDRVKTTVTLTWTETKKLSEHLTWLLKQRAKLEKRIAAEKEKATNGAL